MTFDSRIENSIFLFPHQDDEYFVSGFLHRYRENCLCFYLTEGEGKGIPKMVRNRESTQVLANLDLSENCIRFLPNGLSVLDLQLMNQLEAVFLWILKESKDLNIVRVFCPAWEGGHPDHDAAYLLGKAIGKRNNSEVFEFAMYNGARLPFPFFRAMAFPQKRELLDFPLNWKEKLFFSLLFLNYPSQWKTWAGLAPSVLWRFWLGKGFSVSKAFEDFDKHALKTMETGAIEPPFYEKRKQNTLQIFLESTKAFRKKYLE